MKIGIITNDEHMIYQSQIISGIHSQLDNIHELVILTTNQADSSLEMIERKLDGLEGFVVIANALSDEALGQLYAHEKPISLVSHKRSELPIASVIPDNLGGIERLVTYLVADCACQRIAFIQGDLHQNDGIERRDAFLLSAMQHNIDLDERLMLRGDFIGSVARASVEQLIASQIPFDGLIAADYLMGVEAIKVLQDAQIQIPDDVCVVGFGDGPEADAFGLTTVGVDVVQIGVHVARQIVAQIGGLDIQGITFLATPLVERKTCKRNDYT